MASITTVETEQTVRDYARVLFRHKLVLLVTMASVLAGVFCGLQLRTPMYEAGVTLFISSQKQVTGPYYEELGGRNVEVALTQSEMVKAAPVLERTVEALHLDQRPLDYALPFVSPLNAWLLASRVARQEARLAAWPIEQQRQWRFRTAVDELRSRITTQPMKDTNLFVVTVQDVTPIDAARTANALSRAYLMFDMEQQLAELQLKYGQKHVLVQQLRDYIRRTEETLHGQPLPDLDALGPASVKVIEQASIPLLPAATSSTPLIWVAGVVMGLLLAGLLAFAFDALDHTVKSPQDVQRYLRLPYLGSVPKRRWWNRALLRPVDRRSAYAQAYHTLMEDLYLAVTTKQLRTVLVTSPLKADGVSTVVSNLGLTMARQTDRRVLLIDANVRTPSLHRVLKSMRVTHRAGLADVLEGRVSFEQAVQALGPNVSVLTAGRAGVTPLTLLNQPAMSALLQRCREAYDLTLLDGPDTGRYRDSLVLIPQVDGVLLVIKEGDGRRQVVQVATRSFADLNGKMMGAVLNRRTFAIPSVLYHWL